MSLPEDGTACLGIAGTGAMGQGIAQVAALGDLRVRLLDARPGAADAAAAAVRARLRRLVEKGRMEARPAEAAGACLEPVESLADFAPCHAVVEAITEDLEAKRALFAEIEDVVTPDCLIASNTSSIPIGKIARDCRLKARIGGLHFFNPVPLMRLVEVVRAAETSEATVAGLVALGERLGRVPVVVRDSPGFLVNLGGRAFTTEALRIVHEGIATPSQTDAIMRDCWGYRMGPFELMDLTGMDVNYPVSRLIWEGYQQDPRLATSPNHKAMLDAGRLGRKTGQGWYRYEEGRADVPSPDFVPQDTTPAAWVSVVDETARGLMAGLGIRTGPDDGRCPIVAAPVGPDATATAATAGLDSRRLVCIDPLGDLARRVTLMTAPGADPAILASVAAAIGASGRKITVVADSPGFVGPRIQAMVANLGCYMAEIGLAEPADIDRAMHLGLNYPMGPLELAEQLGLATVEAVLGALHGLTADPRYRPAMWLRRRARLGLPIHTPP